MQELAEKVYTRLSEAIEEVEKDLTYNARKFLGIALYPNSLFSLITFLATIAYGLYEADAS